MKSFCDFFPCLGRDKKENLREEETNQGLLFFTQFLKNKIERIDIHSKSPQGRNQERFVIFFPIIIFFLKIWYLFQK